jgi:cold shock CspA family protein
MQGTMLWFNAVKDLGVIVTEEGERVPVAGREFRQDEKPTGRCAGTAVAFELDGDDGARRAVGVSLVPEVAPRRARMRHARMRSH